MSKSECFAKVYKPTDLSNPCFWTPDLSDFEATVIRTHRSGRSLLNCRHWVTLNLIFQSIPVGSTPPNSQIKKVESCKIKIVSLSLQNPSKAIISTSPRSISLQGRPLRPPAPQTHFGRKQDSAAVLHAKAGFRIINYALFCQLYAVQKLVVWVWCKVAHFGTTFAKLHWPGLSVS